MPENSGQPDDAGTGDEAPPEGGAAGGAGAPDAGGTTPPEKTFTQAEMEAILGERLRRVKPDPELARKAAEFDRLQEGQKTELEKAQEKATKAEARAAEAEARANQRLIRAEIVAQATAQNAVDPDTIVALLGANESITVDDDGNVSGAKEAVKALLKEKAFLTKTGTVGGGPSGGEFGGVDQGTLPERIAALERAGKFAEARDLKIQQMSIVG